MKATEFVKKFGIEFAKKWFAENVGNTPTHQKYVNIVDGEPKGIISTALYGDFHVAELKRLIESHELVSVCGGIDSCKKKVSTRDKCKPTASYFAIHLKKPHLIQLYARNEAKLVPNYSFRDLIKAIADVEACQNDN